MTMKSAPDVLHFYADASPMTSGGSQTRRLKSLPTDLGKLAACVQSLLVYDLVAKDFYGFEGPKSRAGEIHIRPTEKILQRAVELDDLPLTRRVRSTSAYSAGVITSIAGGRGTARARCSCASPLWLRRVLQSASVRGPLDMRVLEHRRRALDPGRHSVRSGVDRQAPHTTRHDVLDVPRNQFLVAADA